MICAIPTIFKNDVPLDPRTLGCSEGPTLVETDTTVAATLKAVATGSTLKAECC